MALHGEIKVNQHVIGYWEAVRLDSDPMFDRYEYKCRVTIQETIQPPPEDPWAVQIRNEDLTFYLWHKFDDGALVLAASVLKHAIKERANG